MVVKLAWDKEGICRRREGYFGSLESEICISERWIENRWTGKIA